MYGGNRWAISIGLLCLSCLMLPGSLRADDFTFSFTNAFGITAGTVTGEILGLTNNATSAATEVLITSYPAVFDPDPALATPPVNATAWTVGSNDFTETSGSITFADFNSLYIDTGSLSGFTQLVISSAAADSELFTSVQILLPSTILNYEAFVVPDSITFAPLTVATPEPSSSGLVLIGFGLVLVLGKRLASRLPQAT